MIVNLTKIYFSKIMLNRFHASLTVSSAISVIEILSRYYHN